MNKSLLSLATAFAVILSLSACSESNNDGDGPEDPTTTGYCVIAEVGWCLSVTSAECTTLIEPAYRSYGNSCPQGYDASPKACYDDDYGDCDWIVPPEFTENDCRGYGGSVMDLVACERTYGDLSGNGGELGSCAQPGYYCVEDATSGRCPVTFTPNGTCSLNTYQYCWSSFEYDGDEYEICERIGGDYVSNKAECVEYGTLASYDFCELMDAEIED